MGLINKATSKVYMRNIYNGSKYCSYSSDIKTFDIILSCYLRYFERRFRNVQLNLFSQHKFNMVYVYQHAIPAYSICMEMILLMCNYLEYTLHNNIIRCKVSNSITILSK